MNNPKFEVGQVVVSREKNPTYFKVRGREYVNDGRGEWSYDLGTIGSWWESELRPLTKRERGE